MLCVEKTSLAWMRIARQSAWLTMMFGRPAPCGTLGVESKNIRLAKRKVAVRCAAAMLLASGPLWADSGPSAARAQLRQGYALKKQGKCKEAVPLLRESAQMDRRSNTLVYLGECEEMLGRLGAAQKHFQEARDLARQERNDKVKDIGEKRLHELERRMPKLSITLAKDAPPGTTVTNDGVELYPLSLREALPVDTGRHVIVARGGGFERQFEVTLAEGETKNLEITPIGGQSAGSAAADKSLPAQTNAASDHSSGKGFELESPSGDHVRSGSTQRALGFVTLGVGLVGLGAAGYFGYRMFKLKADANSFCTETDPCSEDDALIHDTYTNEFRKARTSGLIGLGVGGAATVTGIILLATVPKATTAGWRFAPAVGQGMVGALVGGTW